MISKDRYINEYKVSSVFGRYVTLNHLENFLSQLPNEFVYSTIGYSVNNTPIPMITYGHGAIRILIWSQMHGNESTTTKALIDFLNYLLLSKISNFEEKFTIAVIPILNPDGALTYTRQNANQVDLNRDFINFSEPESIALQKVYDTFKPSLCLNMHDQRTIFGVGDTNFPATMSFLAPAYNLERAYNQERLRACNLINIMVEELQKDIPNQIARFDDAFNPNCVGDHFMSLGTPTILFEAGHYQFDYQREETRFYVFKALIKLLDHLYENDLVRNDLEKYLSIPQNKKSFCDFLFKNIVFDYENCKKSYNFAIQFKEQLIDNNVVFELESNKVDELNDFYGHITVDFGLMSENNQIELTINDLISTLNLNFKKNSKMAMFL